MSHEDLFKVGAAIFNLHKDVGDGAVQAAAPFIELSSEAGNTDARYTLAQLLRTGRGVERNVARAASLFQELAMKAHPYAQVGLSTQPERVCASNGDSPPPTWYPQFMLGTMYQQGVGVDHNLTKAFTLYKVPVASADKVLCTACVATFLPRPPGERNEPGS